MINTKNICITFAGTVGSSKAPITNYISTKLNLPVFNNDAVRSEVIEDLGKFDIKEHAKRRDKMIREIVKNNISFVCDASIDRHWEKFRELLVANNYQWFIISIDLSKKLLTKLYEAKKYFESLERIDELLHDHDVFLINYSSDINLSISDNDFKNRCQLSYEKTTEWLKKIQSN